MTYFDQRVATLNSIKSKAEHLLSLDLKYRNTTNAQFTEMYLDYYHTDLLSQNTRESLMKILTLHESISRAKRLLCHPELEQLKPYLQQYNKIVKYSSNNSNALPDIYHHVLTMIMNITKNSKYLPTDYNLLKMKKISQDATKTWSLQN